MSGVLKDGFWRDRERRASLEDDVQRLRAELKTANDRACDLQGEIDRLRAELVECRASPPPAPEAIVDVWDLRTDGHEVHAFALRSDAEAFADAEPHGEERCITYTGDWTWHGPAAREGDDGMV